jgi:hypothetical protein
MSTSVAVAATVANGRLVVCAKNSADNLLYTNEALPARATWTGWVAIPNSNQSSLAPTVATYQDELWVFCTTSSGTVVASARNADGYWTDWVTIPINRANTTNVPIAATLGSDNQFYLFAKGYTSGAPYNNISSALGAWNDWQLIDTSIATDQPLGALAINVSGANVTHLFIRSSSDNQIYLRTGH